MVEKDKQKAPISIETERPEEEVVFKLPIIIVLGGKEYQVKPLVIREAREWRKKAVKIYSKLPKYSNVDTSNPELFGEAMDALLSTMQNDVTDLFFEYASSLNREEIENTATEIELAEAIKRVMAVAFPLLKSMTSGLGRLNR